MKKIIFWISLILVTSCFADIELPSFNCNFEDLDFDKALYADNDYLILLTSDNTIIMYNVRNVNNIQLVYTNTGSDNKPEIKVRRFDKYMFINFSNQHEDYVIFDISNFNEPQEVNFEGGYVFRDFFVDSLYLYAAIDNEGIAIYDHSTLELITTVEYDYPVQGVSALDSLLFVTLDTPGFDNVLVMNNADINNPVLLNVLDCQSNILINSDKYFVGNNLNLGYEARAYNFIYDYKSMDLSDFPVVNISNINSAPVYCIYENLVHASDSRIETISEPSGATTQDTINHSITFFMSEIDTIELIVEDDSFHSFSRSGYYFVTRNFNTLHNLYAFDEYYSLINVSNDIEGDFITNDNYIFTFSDGSSSAMAYQLQEVDTTVTTPDTVYVYVSSPEITIQSGSPFQSEIDIQVEYADYISIADISGRIVMEFEFDSSRNTVTWTPDEDIPTGAYLVTARNDQAFQTKMVVYLKR